MNGKDTKKRENTPQASIKAVDNPASQPHGSTEDQVNEMESEGQAAKQGQGSEVAGGNEGGRMPNRKGDKKSR